MIPAITVGIRKEHVKIVVKINWLYLQFPCTEFDATSVECVKEKNTQINSADAIYACRGQVLVFL